MGQNHLKDPTLFNLEPHAMDIRTTIGTVLNTNSYPRTRTVCAGRSMDLGPLGGQHSLGMPGCPSALSFFLGGLMVMRAAANNLGFVAGADCFSN